MPIVFASVDEWAGLPAWRSIFVDANSMNRLSSVCDRRCLRLPSANKKIRSKDSIAKQLTE
jgi:hypothetical protein